jgi:GT2 family glycosyltransferase
MNKIAAIIITYNRLELFKQVLSAVRNQSRKPDTIIVVNNNSTDGTTEFLSKEIDLTVVNQDNTGSSGGQYSGIKKAYDMGFDYIWTMDDDVIPEKNCLSEMEKHFAENNIIAPLRRNLKGEIYYNDTIKVNLANPFKSLWSVVFNSDIELTDKINAEGITFEGPAFHRSLIENIGLPEKKFFIYGDDTEYFLRSLKAGYKQYLIPSAILERQIEPPKDLKSFTWKTYYELRNIIAIDILHGNLPVRLIRPFAYFLDRILRVKSFKHFNILIKAFFNGYFYKSEN